MSAPAMRLPNRPGRTSSMLRTLLARRARVPVPPPQTSSPTPNRLMNSLSAMPMTTMHAAHAPDAGSLPPPLPLSPSMSPASLPAMWFNASFPQARPQGKVSFQQTFPAWDTRPLGTNPDKPPDERKVKLGKTLRILQDHLPTLLQNPLPQEILSPNISLHLFPSTHPHLPAVSGRVAYIAALWTSPIAWNRVPVIGNVRLEILTARMVSEPPVTAAPRRAGAVGESLVVRWRTIGKDTSRGSWGLSALINGSGGAGNAGDRGSATTEAASRRRAAVSSDKEFTGLFIFDFDGEGRILSHTIEHVEESGQWDKGVGAKMVGLTDWLLGGIRGSGSGNDTPLPAAFAPVEKKD